MELHTGGPVDLPRFLEFTRTHHSLLFPAFQLQLALKKTLLGVSFWERHAERRVKISKDKFIKIKDLLALHAANKVWYVWVWDWEYLNMGVWICLSYLYCIDTC
ncbi:hypothetical protein EON63_16070 [archaeon]|nr:MAG: hypothetical protein EON63_16070 [archaeon]